MFPDFSPEKHVISVSTATFVKAVLIVAGVWLLWFLRDVVAILFTSLLFAALIDPFAGWFSKRRIPRGLAVIIVYVVLGIVSSLVSILLVPVVIAQTVQLLVNLGVSQTEIDMFLGSAVQFFKHGNEALRALLNVTDLASLRSVYDTFTGILGWIATLVIVMVLTFYLVIEEDTAKKYFKNFAPIQYQPYISQLLNKMQKKIGAWLRGQLLLGIVIGITVYIGLSILGVEYALLLAVIAGLLEIIPYLGPILALIPAALVGFAHSWVMGLVVVALYLVIQQIENSVLVPKIMQKATGLNPVASIVALLIGIKIGPVGAILSIPAATMVAVVLEDLFGEKSPPV